ncbi:MAG: ABC transporter ATP-binding protein [Pirellulaceae bacterium]|nr:ABC transporter ATP-binding protein [Pirellulaceae bacterium]
MNPPDDIVVEAQELTKRFPETLAVDAVTFHLRRGEIFGFLGPNGAGKTTTINMLTGLAWPTGGTIRYLGRDVTRRVKRVQHLMGIVPDDSNLYPELSGFDNLCFCGALYGMPRAERRRRATELLSRFGLSEVAARKFATYSRGMKRKLTIAAALMHRPAVLFLDEPTSGIDVASSRQIRTLLAGLREAGTTIFLTTHYIEEAERLCDRIALVVAGRIVRLDTLSNLVSGLRDAQLMQLALSADATTLLARLHTDFPAATFELTDPTTLRVRSVTPMPLAPVIRCLEEHDVAVTEARLVRPSLEDVFVELTGIEAARMRRDPEKGRGPT